MERNEYYWKNFSLGTELQIAGTFIYNAVYSFDRLEHFYYEHEIFEFLYNVSVGIERLEKIAIILIEGDDIDDQEEFERTLITHNHSELMRRIRKLRTISLGKLHQKFLKLISEFYKSMRYGRYSLSSVYSSDQEKSRFVEFLETELGIEVCSDGFMPTQNNLRIKKYVGKLIGKICSQLYSLIKNEAYRLNMFTYEIPYNSKAYKIFMRCEYTFENEKLFQKELLIHLINGHIDTPYFRFIKDIPPIDFDEYEAQDHIERLLDVHKCQDGIDEVEAIYEDNKLGKDRIELLTLIDANLVFDEDEEE